MSKAAYRSDFSQRAKTLNAGQDRRNARSSQRKCFQPATRSSQGEAGGRVCPRTSAFRFNALSSAGDKSGRVKAAFVHFCEVAADAGFV
jgi:hypothetical protein